MGAVALDVSGHVACGTSTGGIVGKRPGRVTRFPAVVVVVAVVFPQKVGAKPLFQEKGGWCRVVGNFLSFGKSINNGTSMWFVYQQPSKGLPVEVSLGWSLGIVIFDWVGWGRMPKCCSELATDYAIKRENKYYKVRYDFLGYWFYFNFVFLWRFRSADMFLLRTLFATSHRIHISRCFH